MGAAEPLIPSFAHLVALLSGGVVAVRVWEVDVAGRDFHHLLDVAAAFADHVGVLRVRHFHLQCHLVHLDLAFTFLVSSALKKGRRRRQNGDVCQEEKGTLVSRTSRIIFLASNTLTRFPSTFTCGSGRTNVYKRVSLCNLLEQNNWQKKKNMRSK